MPTKTGTRRKQLRYDIKGDRKACVEFSLDVNAAGPGCYVI